MNLIPRFYDTTGGAVRINGTDVREYGLKELRGRIGVVPQRAVLFKGSIRDNMKWGKQDATDEEIMEALEIAQAKDVVESKQGGLNAGLMQGGKNLSGGQRQRLTIARAIVRKPDILILDDSASALDFATDARLRKAIREKTDGMTVFIAVSYTHRRHTGSRGCVNLPVFQEKSSYKGTGEYVSLMKTYRTCILQVVR